MAYDRLSNLEAGQGPSGYTDDPAFRDLQNELKNKVLSLLSSNRQLTSNINALAKKPDNARVRERVHNAMEKSRESCKDIGEGIKKLMAFEDLTKQQKYEQAKVSSDFQTALEDFQNIQRMALEQERASVSAARAAQDLGYDQEGSSDSAPLEQLQRQEVSQLAPQEDVDFQENAIIEREEEIRNIEQGVGDLNVLFRKVAQIVNEQGEDLDTIGANIDNTYNDTRQADIETRQAARYQKAARSKSLCLLLILGIILTIVLLAIFLG